MQNDDVAIIQRVLAGDETAFAELVNKYQKPVHALAWRKIGDFHIAEDITQDTFLKVYQSLHTLKDPNQFAGWLYVIAANLCATWLRKKRIQTQPLEDTETTMTEEDAYSRHVTEERRKTAVAAQREVVKKLLAQLKESERTVMTLYYLGEMKVEEISRFLGVSASTIKSRLRRARHRLKEEEPMIREALDHFQITPNLTENIMREIARLKPIAPSGSKPLVPWAVAASTIAVVLLIVGIGNQHLSRFQRPYSFEATSEMTVDIIEAPVVLNLEAKPDIRTQVGAAAASDEKETSEKPINDVPVLQNSQTWSLPENATVRFSKGVMGGSDRSVAFSPDGKRFAVATGAGIWIYDAETYREISLLTGHTRRVRTVAFSPNGETLASGAEDTTVKLWRVENGENIATFVRNGISVESVAFSPDGKMIAAGTSGNLVNLWDIEKGENLARFKGHASRVFSVAFSPDGKTVASGAEDYTIKLWDVETKQNIATLTGHKDKVFSVAFSPDGRILASGAQDDTVKLWHVETGQDLHTFKHTQRVFSVAFSPDGKVVAGGAWRGIKLWNIETGKDVSTLEARTTISSGSIAFSPDGTQLASASVDRFGGTSGTVTLWDVETGKEQTTLHGHTERIMSVAFSPDGNTLATASRDERVRIWNVKTGENIHTYRGIGYTLAFSPDGEILVSAGWRGIKLWETSTHKNIPTFSIRQEPIRDLAFSPDGQFLALSTEDQVKLRKFAAKSLFGFMYGNTITLKEDKDEVGLVAFSPDGKMLASSTARYGTVKLWDTETGANIGTLKDAGGPVVFSPDGTLLASRGGVQEIKLWDLETRTALMTLRGNGGAVFHLAFSPDSTTLVSGEGFGMIKFWDVATGENIDTLEGHTGAVFSVEFSPDGKTLASGSQDGTVLLWDLKRIADH